MPRYILYNTHAEIKVVDTWNAALEIMKNDTTFLVKKCLNKDTPAFVDSLARKLAPCDYLKQCSVDGGCILHNRAVGGVYFHGGEVITKPLTQPPYTAPRAELFAVIIALTESASPLCIHTDSEMVFRAFMEDFPLKWANQDLLKQIRDNVGKSTCRWVKGHRDSKENKIVDKACADSLSKPQV
jgi:ribonuclease HI